MRVSALVSTPDTYLNRGKVRCADKSEMNTKVGAKTTSSLRYPEFCHKDTKMISEIRESYDALVDLIVDVSE